MSIEKSLYAAPVGLEEALNDEPDLEITIEDPESVEIGVDGSPSCVSRKTMKKMILMRTLPMF
jgi:hypothetical protein